MVAFGFMLENLEILTTITLLIFLEAVVTLLVSIRLPTLEINLVNYM